MKLLVMGREWRARSLIDHIPELRGFRHQSRLGTQMYNVKPGDVIAASGLPLFVIAEICERGGAYLDVSVDGAAVKSGAHPLAATVIRRYYVEQKEVVRHKEEA